MPFVPLVIPSEARDPWRHEERCLRRSQPAGHQDPSALLETRVPKWTFPRLAVGFEVAKPSIKSLHLDELTQHMSAQGAQSYRARQVTDWLYEKRIASFAEMTDLPAATRAQLAKDFSLNQPEVVRVLGSKDTTRKFLFRLTDGNLIESVLIPASPALYGETSDRRTICVSTQVGCAYGCKFCASGLDGFTRNLDAERDRRPAARGRS